jgi:hypothetical protein
MEAKDIDVSVTGDMLVLKGEKRQEKEEKDKNYHCLQGTQTNLYKAFLPTAWRNTNANGAVGLLHPEGVFDDPNGGHPRTSLYSRLRAHFQFANEISNCA